MIFGLRLYEIRQIWIVRAGRKPGMTARRLIDFKVYWLPCEGYHLKSIANRRRLSTLLKTNDWLWMGDKVIVLHPRPHPETGLLIPGRTTPSKGGGGIANPKGTS